MLHLFGLGGEELAYGFGAYEYQWSKVEVVANATLLILIGRYGYGVALLYDIAVAIYPVGLAFCSSAQHTLYGAVAYG